MKKILCISMTVLLIFIVAACGSDEHKVTEPAKKVVFVTDTGLLGGNVLNDAVWEGCMDAKDKYGVEVICLESKTSADYEKNFEEAISDDPILVVTAGADIKKSLEEAASDHPDTSFLIIGEKSKNDNVSGAVFAGEETAFLAGVAAAYDTEYGTVGFVGAENSADSDEYFYGFKAGVISADNGTEVISEYTKKPSEETAAMKLYDAGADVVFSDPESSEGVAAAAKDAGFRVIGNCMSDPESTSDQLLCSVTSSVQDAVFNGIKLADNKQFKNGNVVYCLKNGGVALEDTDDLSSEAQNAVKAWKKAIEEGSFQVPSTETEFKSFKVPEI